MELFAAIKGEILNVLYFFVCLRKGLMIYHYLWKS